MPGLKSFQTVLQQQLSQDDRSWSYQIADLPNPKTTSSVNLIKVVKLVSLEGQPSSIQLRFENAPSNRVMWAERLEDFVLLAAEGFRLRLPSSTPGGSSENTTARESAEYLANLLKAGLTLNNIHYNFFGHSNSQLKSRSCLLFAASKEEVWKKVEDLGDFSKIKSVAKKAKRIGLLFSSTEMGLTLPEDRCEDIDDVERQGYTFTDGCGLISKSLARQLVQRQDITYRNRRYLPSVFQIRYRGYKGVLTLDPSLKGKVLVQFRGSMKKFKDAKDLSLSAVDYSKPYSFGYLNDEIVTLLNAMGISDTTLLRKQEDHLKFLENAAMGRVREAFRFLAFCERLDLAEKLLLNGVESVSGTLKALVRQEYSKMLNKYEEQRCRIMVPRSRLLFGVCDPTSKDGSSGILPQGTCFVRITDDGDGEAKTLTNTEVLVTRNPCLHPGDLQKFRVVDVPEFSHLVDCIVFTTQGKRPSADLMSGGDLDGDKFFVTWDSDLVPDNISQPAEYPGVKEPISFAKITNDDRAEYFARYTNASLGRVKNMYLKWARLKGPMSSECQQLNRLFSQCVDGNRIKVPQILEDPPEPDESCQPFILDVLHEAAGRTIEAARWQKPYKEELSIDSMELLLSRDQVAMSEFELVQFALKLCNRSGESFDHLAQHFNFRSLSDEQQAWLLNQIPPSEHFPSLVRNGLLQSRLVYPSEMRAFKLDHHRLHWKPVFDSSADRMGRFIPTLCRSLEIFHKKLIILRADERLTLAIYVPSKVSKASEVQVDASVRVFALPQSQGSGSPGYRVVPTKVNYRLYCDESTFQLYEGKRANTWIFLARGPKDDSSYRNAETHRDRRHKLQQTLDDRNNFDCRASIALQKIGKGIQTHVGRMNRAGVLDSEIYVISNRDVESMRLLDLWLEYVDTQVVHPLFAQVEEKYTTPRLAIVNWNDLPEDVVKVIRGREFSRLKVIANVDHVQQILDILNVHGEIILLRNVYQQLLKDESADIVNMDRKRLALTLLDFLPSAVFLIDPFLQSQTWQNHKEHLEDRFNSLVPTLLRQLILAINSMQAFVRRPFQALMKELAHLSMQSLSELVEVAIVCVREPEMALDLLLDLIEPELSRLVVGRPKSVKSFAMQLFGIALDHIDEASNPKGMPDSLKLESDGSSDGMFVVKGMVRIDSSLNGLLRQNDHVRLTVSEPPDNAPLEKPFTMDALVSIAEPGKAVFNCLHCPPPYLENCAWNLEHCGSFVTSKTMIDAVTKFFTEKETCCRLFGLLLGVESDNSLDTSDAKYTITPEECLNESQNLALSVSMRSPLSFLWGPPGTGKTHTIVAILIRLLKDSPQKRVLVTAPTHNAVDNILQKFVKEDGLTKSGVKPVRVSTNIVKVHKVSSDLREFTCDAMVGKDLNANMGARNKAQKRVKESRLIFTTCIGAGLGLLRDEIFEIVLVDEASQQTEPGTLVPLVKGCQRAILVGDHVQLRATVQKNAVLVGFDVSLFERQYDLPQRSGVAKVMLNTQYRMHPDICSFSSSEFYEGKLKSAVSESERLLADCKFPWPHQARKLFVQCSATEDIGHQSKSNQGQADLCRLICQQLTTTAASNGDTSNSKKGFEASQITILTPYTRQRELLSSKLPRHTVSSIDGYQGKESDIIVFVTVRCNNHFEIGFLKDLRRLNVAMTRARVGVIIIGDKATLVNVKQDEDVDESKACWRRLIAACEEVEFPNRKEEEEEEGKQKAEDEGAATTKTETKVESKTGGRRGRRKR